jgi:hypothetical protein
MKETKIINGIEGDDIPYHLNILGHQLNPGDIFFVALNDHYGLHDAGWLECTLEESHKYSRVVFYDLVNTGDECHDQFCNFINKFEHHNKCYLTNNFSKRFMLPGVTIVPWDFMWNRVKLYYTNKMDLTHDPYLHHFAGKHSYQLNQIKFNTREKIFLNLCGRAYGCRIDLYNFLEQYSTLGYRSMRSEGITLDDKEAVGAYVPIPNKYYNDSYVSIYIESNTATQELVHITEKTFEPLIKGHFILPFSNPGTIDRLLDLGFLLPDFIDYSYDNIIDANQRFNTFKEVITNVMTLDWSNLYIKNKDIIIHNRQQLFNLDYDRSILGLFNV